MSELQAGTYWVAHADGTAIALVVEPYWLDDTFATWGPAGLVMYGAVDSDRLRELSLSRMSLRLGGRPSWVGDDAPDESQVARLWKAEQRARQRREALAIAKRPAGPAMGGFSAKQAGESADRFYRRVAEFYLLSAERTGKPLLDIQESAGVPKSTAARWAREARARGFLPETTRGKG